MKKNIARVLMAAALAAAFAVPVLATSPDNIILAYNPETMILSVEVIHPTLSKEVHYISKIEIKQGEETVKSETYESQTSAKSQVASFSLPHSAMGKELTVIATCSINGDMKKTIKAE